MRKFILKGLFLVALLMYSSGRVYASQPQNSVYSKLIEAIAKVESGNNPKAIGKGGAVGLLQITPILVKECNLILQSKKILKKYYLKDRLNREKSIEMFYLIQEKYNPSGNIEKAIRVWNGGPNYSVRATQPYYNKVTRHLN